MSAKAISEEELERMLGPEGAARALLAMGKQDASVLDPREWDLLKSYFGEDIWEVFPTGRP
jgi:hypothetical protein